MKLEDDERKVAAFIAFSWPIVADLVRTVFERLGCKVCCRGYGLDAVLEIEAGERKASFYLHNLLLEIATVDRDERPLRFDENLADFEFFLRKTLRLVQGKIFILQQFFSAGDVEAAIEKLSEMAKDYQRLRIIRWDGRIPP